MESRTGEARGLEVGGTGWEEDWSGRMSWENWCRVTSGLVERGDTALQAVAHGAKSCAEKARHEGMMPPASLAGGG